VIHHLVRLSTCRNHREITVPVSSETSLDERKPWPSLFIRLDDDEEGPDENGYVEEDASTSRRLRSKSPTQRM
jgi:hypothetical protein